MVNILVIFFLLYNMSMNGDETCMALENEDSSIAQSATPPITPPVFIWWDHISDTFQEKKTFIIPSSFGTEVPLEGAKSQGQPAAGNGRKQTQPLLVPHFVALGRTLKRILEIVFVRSIIALNTGVRALNRNVKNLIRREIAAARKKLHRSDTEDIDIY